MVDEYVEAFEVLEGFAAHGLSTFQSVLSACEPFSFLRIPQVALRRCQMSSHC